VAPSTKTAVLVLGLLFLASKKTSSSAGKGLTLAQLRALALSVGFPDPSLAAAVAMAESGGNVSAVGDVLLGTSIGLWQIHVPSHPDWARQNLFDPTTNARAALDISKGGTDFTPWTTFKKGLHKPYLGGSAS